MKTANGLSDLRKSMRAQRRAIPERRQQVAARQVAAHLKHLSEYNTATVITCYRAIQGELDTNLVIEDIQRRGDHCYLPVLGQDWSMEFAEVKAGQRLHKNHWGLWEPGPLARRASPQEIDVALVPLVAFDKSGARLGMGGGYYDRYFAFSDASIQRPFLVGLAHTIQQVDSLESQPWDVPLNAVVTPRGILRFRPTFKGS